MFRSSLQLITALSLWCLTAAATAPEQFDDDEPRSDLNLKTFDPDNFTFVRIVYDSAGGNGEAWYRGDRGWTPRWATDHPDGALNLTWRLNQLTTIKANEGTLLLRLTDERLSDFPFIFMSDPGWQELRRDERIALRRYLENGGFLWVDDFWGIAEWENLERNTLAESPGWKWIDIPNGPSDSVDGLSDDCMPASDRISVLYAQRRDLRSARVSISCLTVALRNFRRFTFAA